MDAMRLLARSAECGDARSERGIGNVDARRPLPEVVADRSRVLEAFVGITVQARVGSGVSRVA